MNDVLHIIAIMLLLLTTATVLKRWSSLSTIGMPIQYKILDAVIPSFLIGVSIAVITML